MSVFACLAIATAELLEQIEIMTVVNEHASHPFETPLSELRPLSSEGARHLDSPANEVDVT